MSRLTDEIMVFLETNGFKCSHQVRNGLGVICTETIDGRYSRTILPIEIDALNLEEAEAARKATSKSIQTIKELEGYPLIITEDRWKRQRSLTESRLMAHLELFEQAFARNCEVRRIEKSEAQSFLEANHSYGHAACKYCYGLFLKRHDPGKLIAVSTFSNARRWIKNGKEIRSYEWTRYASLPNLRISGGMGKVLKAFIKDICPDDIMSYADLEWSEGGAYKQLGFSYEGDKEPVSFIIDTATWSRTAIRNNDSEDSRNNIAEGTRYFINFGSKKYRLKLTEYE
jgi:hypothetical protein